MTTIIDAFVQRLLAKQLLTASQAKQYQQHASSEHCSLISYLLQHHLLATDQLAIEIAEHFNLPLQDLDDVDATQMPLTLMPEALLQSGKLLPLWQRDQCLFIGIADPANVTCLRELKFHTGLQTQAMIVDHTKLQQKLASIAQTKQYAILNHLTTEQQSKHDNTDPHIDDAPVVRFINTLLSDAIAKKASDIHFEPYINYYRIRFRIDGLLTIIAEPPSQHAKRITTRIKVMAKLDITEHRLPQDGHFCHTDPNHQPYDCRVNVIPTVSGEKIVIRILDPANTAIKIHELGMNALQNTLFTQVLARTQGMILVTGPTGSGKTMTLYAALQALNDPAKNISSVEDPVEINLTGINQININSKTNLTFATALRALLRQDPDSIMIGEIRDLETAEIAVKAAQTGHLVLSTLHTNNSIETINRLLNMGIPRFQLANAITLIIAQRLVRKLCKHCQNNSANPHSCRHCNNGYQGRIAVFEMLSITDQINKLILAGADQHTIQQQALNNGMQTLQAASLDLVKQNITDLAEVNRMIN